jgi:hypothetical protein
MQFYRDRRAPLMWIGLAVLNVAMSADRYVRHGSHDRFALVQGILWFCILVVWTSIATTRWIFTDAALLQRRVGSRQRTLPYQSITAVDPPVYGKSREAAVIVYGDDGPITYQERLTVEPKDFAGFLAELERIAPQAVFKV